MKGFVNQYSLKNDQYPKTMQDMTDALSKHAFDDKYYKHQKKKAEKRKRKRSAIRTTITTMTMKVTMKKLRLALRKL